MKFGKTIKLVLAGTCLAVAGFMLYKNWGDPPPRGPKAFTHWICVGDACKHEFTLPWAKYQNQKSTGMKCEKCATPDPERGTQCPACLRILPLGAHGSPPKTCIHCKAPVPPRPKDPPPGAEG